MFLKIVQEEWSASMVKDLLMKIGLIVSIIFLLLVILFAIDRWHYHRNQNEMNRRANRNFEEWFDGECLYEERALKIWQSEGINSWHPSPSIKNDILDRFPEDDEYIEVVERILSGDFSFNEEDENFMSAREFSDGVHWISRRYQGRHLLSSWRGYIDRMRWPDEQYVEDADVDD